MYYQTIYYAHWRTKLEEVLRHRPSSVYCDFVVQSSRVHTELSRVQKAVIVDSKGQALAEVMQQPSKMGHYPYGESVEEALERIGKPKEKATHVVITAIESQNYWELCWGYTSFALERIVERYSLQDGGRTILSQETRRDYVKDFESLTKLLETWEDENV